MKVKDILKEKGTEVKTISSGEIVKNALQSMIANKIGSLVVTESGGKPIGIITERDILHFIARSNDWMETLIAEVMTKDIIIGLPSDDVEVIMALMTQNYFRHVPIICENKLIGIISIGDIVKADLKNIKAENRYLSAYVTGQYPC